MGTVHQSSHQSSHLQPSSEAEADRAVAESYAFDGQHQHPALSVRASDPELHQFISMTAHELREPLQAIQGFLSVVLHNRVGPLNPIQQDFLSSAYVAGRRLERLICDLQTLVIGERAFPINCEPCDMHARSVACVRELESAAESYGVSVEVEPRGHGPWVAWGDPERIDQVLLNLIENAVRYSSRGTIVRVRLRAGATGVLITVHNTIDTMPHEDTRRWFAPFTRGSQSATQPAGLGLGLAVADHLVHRHGGYITARMRRHHVAIRFVLPISNAPHTNQRESLTNQRLKTGVVTAFMSAGVLSSALGLVSPF
jgi:signal transduction histidine kinase